MVFRTAKGWRRTGVAGVLALAFCFSAAGASAQDPGEARQALDRGDYEVAEQLLSGADAKSTAEIRLMATELDLVRGRYKSAATRAQALAKLPDVEAAAVALWASALRRQGLVDDAIKVLKDIESNPDARRARLLLGELLIETGRRGEARAPLMTLIEDYNTEAITSTNAEGLSMVGRAAHLLRSARDANDAFKEAEQAGGDKRVETLLWRADLFLEKYDPGNAGSVVLDAVKLAPHNPDVHVALASVKLESAMDFAAAESEIKEALRINPQLTSAYFVQAGLALRDLDTVAADAAVAKGLAVNPRDLPLLSMKAAIRYLADDPAGYERIKKQVFAFNGQYAEFYQIVSEYAEWEHRYDDIVRMMKEAIQVDSEDPRGYAALGLNLIRAGREDEGLKALQDAWDKDHFNVRVLNTLNLYEKSIATQYVTVEGQVFRIRYHKDEQRILERYVPAMLKEAWGSMVKRYKFTPSTPVTIELYADNEHFSVRTSGLPNVGIQGVCFGKTLALLSPSAAAFNWGNVLWHELGHVFAIQLSKSHVPRWYTEGLSEYETIVRRKEWQREEDPALYAALKADRIPSVESFNRAFTHVDSVEQVTMAYYAASQLVVFMVDEFGFDRVVTMMPKWAEGKRTQAVVKESLGIEPAELDRRFKVWLGKKLARYDNQYVPDLHAPPLAEAKDAAEAKPNDARAQVQLAIALLSEGKGAEAKAALERALAIDPKSGDAMFVKLRIAISEKDFDGAKALVKQLLSSGNDGYAVRMFAANLAEIDDSKGEMQDHFEEAGRFDPSQAGPLQGLVDLASDRSDGIRELRALRKLSGLDQHDRRVWGRLLSSLVERGQWEEAVEVGESAVFVDVRNPEVHRLYARALARTGRHHSAVREYNSAIVAGADAEMLVDIYGQLAIAYERMGRKDYHQKALDLQARVKRMGSPKGGAPGKGASSAQP